MAVQALFHPNSFGFWPSLTSVLGCHETWMGDSNLVAVDFVINQTQVCPGLWICVPAQLACLGWRKGCWACEEELGIVVASETGTPALDTVCVQVWLVLVPWERAAQDCVPVLMRFPCKQGKAWGCWKSTFANSYFATRELPFLILVLWWKNRGQHGKKKSQSPLDPSSCLRAGLCGACSGFKTVLF